MTIISSYNLIYVDELFFLSVDYRYKGNANIKIKFNLFRPYIYHNLDFWRIAPYTFR